MPISALINGAYDVVAGAPSPATTGTSITVTNSSRWPDPATVGPYPVSIWGTGVPYSNDAGTRAMVTAKAGAVLTIVRDIEGASARAVVVGDQIALIASKQDIQAVASVGSRNMLINGGLRYWQRQAPATPTARADDTFGPDRWIVITQTATVNINRDLALASDGFKSYYGGTFLQPQVASQRYGLLQIIEGAKTHEIRGETMRFEFKAASNNSVVLRYALLAWTGAIDAVTSDVVLSWTSGTYTANNFFLAANLSVIAVGSTTLPAGATLCSVRGLMPTTANNAIVMWWTEAVQPTNAVVWASDFWLVEDSISEPYISRGAAEELAECQRFYSKSYEIDTAPATSTTGTAHAHVAGSGSDFYVCTVRFPVPLRIAPTLTSYDVTGNSGKLTEIAAGFAQTNNVTPSLGFVSKQPGLQMYHDAAGTVLGFLFEWTADAEL